MVTDCELQSEKDKLERTLVQQLVATQATSLALKASIEQRGRKLGVHEFFDMGIISFMKYAS